MIANNSNIQYHVNSITLTLSQFLRPIKETREGHEKLVLPIYLGWYIFWEYMYGKRLGYFTSFSTQ